MRPTLDRQVSAEAHNDCDRLKRAVKKMYNKQASIKIVTAITL
jgi:hypothetical protein